MLTRETTPTPHGSALPLHKAVRMPMATHKATEVRPVAEAGFVDLQGESRATWEAERLRLMVWTGVVRWLAKEAALGWSPGQVALVRDAARARINEQVDAAWWMRRRGRFVEPGSLLDGAEGGRTHQQPAPKYVRKVAVKVGAADGHNGFHAEDGVRAARLIVGSNVKDALNGTVVGGEPEQEEAGRWAHAVLAELRAAQDASVLDASNSGREPHEQEVPAERSGSGSGKLGELVETVRTKLGALRRRPWIPGPNHPWRHTTFRRPPPNWSG
jgi:hypothetical protein